MSKPGNCKTSCEASDPSFFVAGWHTALRCEFELFGRGPPGQRPGSSRSEPFGKSTCSLSWSSSSSYFFFVVVVCGSCVYGLQPQRAATLVVACPVLRPLCPRALPDPDPVPQTRPLPPSPPLLPFPVSRTGYPVRAAAGAKGTGSGWRGPGSGPGRGPGLMGPYYMYMLLVIHIVRCPCSRHAQART